MFSEKGFEQTTFKDIAERSKVTQPLLYSYFKDKMDLLYECCLYSAEVGRTEIRKHISSTTSAFENLQQYILGNLTWFNKDTENAHIILSMYYFAGTDKKIRKVFYLSQQKAQESIYEILLKGHQQKEWNCSSLHDVSQSIHSLVVGEIYKQFYPMENKKPKERSEQLINSCIQLLSGS